MRVSIEDKVKISIDRAQMFDLMEALECDNPHEAFGMLCLALSLIYREVWAQSGVTLTEFTDKLGLQVRQMIDKPPSGYTDKELYEPTPGCSCDACRLLRERKARAN